MIKSVSIDPVKIQEDLTSARVFVVVNAAELSALYEKSGIDAATIAVTAETSEQMPLKNAVDAGLDVIGIAVIDIGRIASN